jgi:hypothetical protein
MPTNLTADFFIQHLGKTIDGIDKAVFAYAYEPDFSLPDHSPIGGIFFKKLGFSITFCPPDFYHCNAMLANQPAILTNVQIYSGDEDYDHAPYPHALPHGIAFTDSRSALIAKLGPAKWTFPFVAPFKMERWDFADHWLNVEYTADMAGLRMIQIGLQPNAPSTSVLPKILQTNIHTLQQLFEKPWQLVAQDPSLLAADFSDLKAASAGDPESHEVDELKTLGIELYFRPSGKANEIGHILTGARYIRKGVYFSVGFDGELPKGLQFSDRPEEVVRKVGSYPVTGKADVLTGYFVWKLPEYMLHVGFSVMEQRVNRVRVAAHPYYAQELLESPRLIAPV